MKHIVIYQIPAKEQYKQYLFTDVFYQSQKPNLSLSIYDPVYSFDVTTKKSDDELLEHFFYVFNMNHPSDYQSRSVSVSDIIQIDDQYYYCRSIGWENVTSYV